jgi:hypothetical protein
MNNQGRNVIGLLAGVWGVVGLSGLFILVVYRLGLRTLDAVAFDWTFLQWIVLVFNVVFMAWSEGYRGFQMAFSPRAAARAYHLTKSPRPLEILLAPVFCVGYFGATPRVRNVVWLGTLAILVVVLLVRQLDQPWRGIVDAGVVVGLTWGTLSFWYFSARVFLTGQPACSAEVPEPE